MNDKQKKALLFCQAGPETQEIFETLTNTGDDYKTAQEKLDAHLLPKKNVDNEIFQFRQAVQQPGETINRFATRSWKIAINCEFHDTSKEIKAVIIQNCQSKRLWRYTLHEDALTLDDLLAKAHSSEASEMQATGIKKSPPHTAEEVNQVHHENKQSIRDKAVSIAHGLEKTKQLHHEKIWFPGIDDTVQRIIKKCIARQTSGTSNPQTPSRCLPYCPTLGVPSTWTSVVLFLQEITYSLPSMHTHDSVRLRYIC